MPSKTDPAYVEPSYLRIQAGVPIRKGVRKHCIVDGPRTGMDDSNWRPKQKAGQAISLSCFDDVTYGKGLYGEETDAFVVNLRFVMPEYPKSMAILTRRSGWRELNAALWNSEKTEPCDHKVEIGQEVTLPPGSIAVSAFGDAESASTPATPIKERIIICLTANSIAARWRALIAILSDRKKTDNEERILLRKPDCCLSCAIAQSAIRRGRCFLIL